MQSSVRSKQVPPSSHFFFGPGTSCRAFPRLSFFEFENARRVMEGEVSSCSLLTTHLVAVGLLHAVGKGCRQP